MTPPLQTTFGPVVCILAVALGASAQTPDRKALIHELSKPRSSKASKSASPELRIVGGSECDPSDLRAVGALLYDGMPHCTATYIGKGMLLTAAHCLMGYDYSRLSFSNSKIPSRQGEIRVVGAVMHEKYTIRADGTPVNDVGVAFLAEAPRNTKRLRLIYWAVSNSDLAKKKLKFIGYGYADGVNGTGIGVKRCVDMPVASVTEQTFLYSVPTANTCNGDSGGPALEQINGQWFIVGITSYGDRTCQIFGVDTRVDAYTGWISAFRPTLHNISCYSDNSFGDRSDPFSGDE